MKPSWDIFCSVVDNYGDIGVTWRLARQLVAEHGVAVRLWVDDLRAFAPMCPGVDLDARHQWQQGVEVCQWPCDWRATGAADVVIEAFACQLPEAYLEAMRGRSQPSLWLNLEYLSAEDWVTGCHGLRSMRSDGLQKFFFFPGFQAGTGGLLLEQGLIEQRKAFQQGTQEKAAFLQGLGVMPAAGARLISLFAYENAGLASWLNVLVADVRANHMLVPQGRILGDLQRWFGGEVLQIGALVRRGSLTVQVLPFVHQQDYDRLLWSCDFNAVRGEDSFVRAQWAGRPLLWHIYEQQENAHWVKLEAFLELYLQGLSAGAAEALRGLWRAWNAGQDMGSDWHLLAKNESEITEHAQRWCLERALQPDLAAALVQFYRNWI